MIDFQNKKVFKLSKSKEKNVPKDIIELLVPDEQIIGYYSSLRDYVVFTSKRLIAMYKESLVQKKISLLCLILKFKLSQLKLLEL